MTAVELLQHPLFIALLGVVGTVFIALIGFIVRQVVLASFSSVRASVKGLSEDMEAHAKKHVEAEGKISAINTAITNMKQDQEQFERSTGALAKAVQRVLIALPTNYATKDDIRGICEKLDEIGKNVADKPSRQEMNDRLRDQNQK